MHVGLRRAGQRQHIGIGDAVADGCRVRRERADHRRLHHRRRRRRRHRADRNRGVAELQEVDVLERVGAVRAAGAQIDDLPAAVGVLRHLVGRRCARIDRGVGAADAVERVVACPAGELVVGDVAGDDVAAGAADRVLDQRGRVVVVEIGVGDVADRGVAGAEIGQLRRRHRRPAARLQVDGDVGGVVREVIGVVAAAVPDRHEDRVAAGRGLRDAVDGLLPGRRIPLVDGVAAVGVVVRAVDVLQRRDVVHHQRLRKAPGRVGEPLRGRRPDVGAVAHHGVFERVRADRHRAERARRHRADA